MSLALVIVGGVVIISVVASVGDYLTKTRIAKTSIDPNIIKNLEGRIEMLEQKTTEQGNKIQNLETDIAFANKLLEDKTKK